MTEQLIRKTNGALTFTSNKKCLFLFNWNDNIMEIWLNGEREIVIDMNGELK